MPLTKLFLPVLLISKHTQIGSGTILMHSTIVNANSKIGKNIVLVPIAFVSEHSETLVELDIEYKKLAIDNGCKQYTRIPALGINEDFIKSISELIVKKDEYKFNDYLYPPIIKCPSNLKKCPCLNYE